MLKLANKQIKIIQESQNTDFLKKTMNNNL